MASEQVAAAATLVAAIAGQLISCKMTKVAAKEAAKGDFTTADSFRKPD